MELFNHTVPARSRPDHVLTALQQVVSRAANVTIRLRAVAARTGAIIIDPTDYFCSESKCPTVSSDGMPLYTDDQHLRASYARRAAVFIDSIFAH